MFKTIIFDVYGTLYDVNSLEEKCEELFPKYGVLLCQQWRKRQLEYTWVRTLMKQYENFWIITKDALCDACDELKLEYSYKDIENLLNEYLTLKPYSEVLYTLKQINSQKKVILSNGTNDMLNGLLNNTLLKQYFDDIVSADEQQAYKPTKEVYELVLEKTGFNRNEILFISSNCWDISGAKNFGYKVCWINRFDKKMERLGKTPDYIIDDLNGLLQILN
jgi:2-haloacid dehalogenase